MVHVIFDPESVSLDEFFQEGGGWYFEGVPYQRGYGMRGAGFGNIFKTFLRFILPMAKKAGKTVGKEALTTGARILDNIAQGADLKTTVLAESKEGAKRVAKRVAQSGSGIPRKKRKMAVTRKAKRKRFPKKSLLGKQVLKAIALRNPKTALGFY